MSDDFYEDDEPIEDIKAAWNQGEKGVTTGKKDLNQRARSIVDEAIRRLEAEPVHPPHIVVVGVGTAAGSPIVRDLRIYSGEVLEVAEDEDLVTAVRYRVG